MDDTATEILEATHRALCRHGYAALTLRSVADEASVSRASIHYHYDGKAALVRQLLDHLYDRYTTRLSATDGGTALERLVALFDAVLADGEAALGRQFRTALLAFGAQAPYDEAIRARLADFDAFLRQRVREIVEAGVETGEFADCVDPAAASELLVTAVAGAHSRSVAIERSTEQLREAMTQGVARHLTGGQSLDASEAAR